MKYLFTSGLLLACTLSVFAQQKTPRFWKDIQQFKKADSLQAPPQKAILFTGSSSIRRWTDVAKAFPDYTVLNRGFGGSKLPDVIRYVPDIIVPYHPRQVVIYCGDNDAASSSSTVTADTITNRFIKLYQLIRSDLPKTQITYISIKPSPSREKLFPVMEKANWQIQQFLKNEKRADYVDVWHLMLDDHGQPMPELFGSDMLHMNAKGYAIWQKAIRPYLVKK